MHCNYKITLIFEFTSAISTDTFKCMLMHENKVKKII